MVDSWVMVDGTAVAKASYIDGPKPDLKEGRK